MTTATLEYGAHGPDQATALLHLALGVKAERLEPDLSTLSVQISRLAHIDVDGVDTPVVDDHPATWVRLAVQVTPRPA